MRLSSLFLSLLFVISSQAETILSEADVMLNKQTYDVCANLYAGTKIFVDEELADRKVKIFLKVYAKAKDRKYGKLQSGSTIYNQEGKAIGKVLIPFNLLENPDSTGLPYFIYLRAYIFSDRIDPKSIPEKELTQLIQKHEGKLDSSQLNPFLGTFGFQLLEDTLGFKLLRMEEHNQTRMTLVFKDWRLVAVVPERKMEIGFFEYKLSQEHVDIYYYERLKEEEEEWMIHFFGMR